MSRISVFLLCSLLVLSVVAPALADDVTSLDGTQGWYRSSLNTDLSADQASVGTGSLLFDHSGGETELAYYVPQAPFGWLIELVNGKISFDAYVDSSSGGNLPQFVLFLSTPLGATLPPSITTLTWTGSPASMGSWNTYDQLLAGQWTSNQATPHTGTLSQWADGMFEGVGIDTEVTGWGFATDSGWGSDTLAYVDNAFLQFDPMFSGVSEDPIVANFEATGELTTVPEPASILLMGLGLVGLLFWRKRA